MHSESRFDAEKIERLLTLNDSGRFELHFSDKSGKRYVVSLPQASALALAQLMCDVAEKAPFLFGRASAHKFK